MLTRRDLLRTSLASTAATVCAPAVIARPSTQTFFATPDDAHPITPIGPGVIPDTYMRQIVPYSTNLHPGAIVVDSTNRFLYVQLDHGRAMRFAVAVGREGFAWSGQAQIMRKVMWPTWTPPASMIARDKSLAKYARGMPGGPETPSALALCIFTRMAGTRSIVSTAPTSQPASARPRHPDAFACSTRTW